MSVTLWRIACDTPDYQAHDLSGKGAEMTGGRWNRKGRPVTYCATNMALAVLETLVHFNAQGLPLNRYLVRIEVPDDVWASAVLQSPRTLPVGWEAIPEGQVSLDVGDLWLQQSPSAVMIVPSAIVPEESNVLLNPRHADCARIRAVKVRQWRYDHRLMF